MPSEVLEHGAGYEKGHKCKFSRAGGPTDVLGGCRLGTIGGGIVRKWGPGGEGCVHFAIGLFSSGDSAGGGNASGVDVVGGGNARGPR